MTDRISFRISLWVRSPFLFRGLDAKHLGLDAAQLRDEERRSIIPGDQMRGVLREAFADLAAVGAIAANELDELFGKPSHNEQDTDTSNDPVRGRMILSDMTARGMLRDLAEGGEGEGLPGAAEAGETTRIEIDDVLGAARHGMLQLVELAAPLGAAVQFSGEIVVFRPAAEADRLGSLLNRAVKLIPAIGAFKSPGFGEVPVDRSKVELVGPPHALALPGQARSMPDFTTLRVSFDRPILVDAERISDNVFRGSSIIPGGVFKGALARRVELAGHDPAAGVLGRALAEISISHAFPESEEPGERGLLPLPLSLVAVKDDDGKLYFGDALHVPDGRGAMIAGMAALFASDWKPGWSDAEELQLALGRPKAEEPPPLSRTHTAIEDGIAKDQALFTLIGRSVRKRDASANFVDRTWLLDIDLGAITDRAVRDCALRLVSALIEDGLDNIGKTGARAHFEPVKATPPPQPNDKHMPDKDNRYAIVLETPALMLDPARICGADGKWAQEPREAYRGYWSSVLPGSRLHSFFAQQRLTGGYLARRRRLYGPGRYFPFLLTEAGSVFEIETTDLKRLRELWRFGLPPARLQGTIAPLGWRNCPYLPENGYGRIFAHLTTPSEKALLKEVRDV